MYFLDDFSFLIKDENVFKLKMKYLFRLNTNTQRHHRVLGTAPSGATFGSANPVSHSRQAGARGGPAHARDKNEGPAARAGNRTWTHSAKGGRCVARAEGTRRDTDPGGPPAASSTTAAPAQ